MHRKTIENEVAELVRRRMPTLTFCQLMIGTVEQPGPAPLKAVRFPAAVDDTGASVESGGSECRPLGSGTFAAAPK